MEYHFFFSVFIYMSASCVSTFRSYVVSRSRPFLFLLHGRRERVWPTAVELPVMAFTQCRVSVNWLEVSGRMMNPLIKATWLPAYLKPINTHGKLYDSGPPFPSSRAIKRERVGYARLVLCASILGDIPPFFLLLTFISSL